MDQELAEHGAQIATINPGPFLTGFNDTMFETWKSWIDDPAARSVDYAKLAFPHEQFDPEEVYQVTLDVLAGKDTAYRHVLPASTVDDIRAQTESQWDRLLNDGRRPETAQAAYDLQPATRVSTHTD